MILPKVTQTFQWYNYFNIICITISKCFPCYSCFGFDGSKFAISLLGISLQNCFLHSFPCIMRLHHNVQILWIIYLVIIYFADAVINRVQFLNVTCVFLLLTLCAAASDPAPAIAIVLLASMYASLQSKRLHRCSIKFDFLLVFHVPRASLLTSSHLFVLNFDG